MRSLTTQIETFLIKIRIIIKPKHNTMKQNDFFITILLVMCVFFILTLPHITLMLFDFGIRYSMNAMVFIPLISILITFFIIIPYLKKKKIM